MQGDNYVVKATCKGCLSFPGGKLDTHSTAQPFIYAVGPNIPLASNDLSVGLRRHIGYGSFPISIDLPSAGNHYSQNEQATSQ